MTNDQKSKVAELKALIAATATTSEGAPAKVRATALELKRELRDLASRRARGGDFRSRDHAVPLGEGSGHDTRSAGGEKDTPR